MSLVVQLSVAIALSASPSDLFNPAAKKLDDAFKYKPALEEALKDLRAGADGRTADRQADFEQEKSYRNPKAARCVFAKAPFEDGKKNDELTYRYSAATPKVYVRCYATEKVQSLMAVGWQPYIRLSVNQYMGWGTPATVTHEKGNDADILEATFTLPPADIAKDDFAVIDVEFGVERQQLNSRNFDKKLFGSRFAFVWEKTAP